MFFKKDMLLFLKDWKGLIVVLVSPLVLILILGFAIEGISSGDSEAFRVETALVMAVDTEQAIEKFAISLEQRGLQDDERATLVAAAQELAPSRLLLQMLDYEEVRAFAAIQEMDTEQAQAALEAEAVDAILTVPADFDYAGLSRMLLNEGPGISLAVTAGGDSGFQVQLFEEIIESFTRSLSFQTVLIQELEAAGASSAAIDAALWQAVVVPMGGLDPDAQVEPVTSFQYFTFSMTVLFVLFVASNAAGRAYREKKQLVYDRILLSNRSPLRYLGAKTTSTALIAWLQMMLVFAVSHLILDVFPGAGLNIWLGLGLISAALAVFVGGFCALFTALNYRFNSQVASLLFSGVGVTIMAVLGGSMGPLATMPVWVSRLGIWTPNGLSLSAYIQWIQEGSFSQLVYPMLYLMIGAAFLLAVGFWAFPVRGKTA